MFSSSEARKAYLAGAARRLSSIAHPTGMQVDSWESQNIIGTLPHHFVRVLVSSECHLNTQVQEAEWRHACTQVLVKGDKDTQKQCVVDLSAELQLGHEVIF